MKQMKRHWSETSRYSALRQYELLDNVLTITCYNVLYCSFSTGPDNVILTSVDPAGGPHLRVGECIIHEDIKLKIDNIVSYTRKNKNVGVIMLNVTHA
jgi:hypothetical protein